MLRFNMITGITEPAWDTLDLVFQTIKYLPAKENLWELVALIHFTALGSA